MRKRLGNRPSKEDEEAAMDRSRQEQKKLQQSLDQVAKGQEALNKKLAKMDTQIRGLKEMTALLKKITKSLSRQ